MQAEYAALRKKYQLLWALVYETAEQKYTCRKSGDSPA
jgi:hypothetical protein